MHDFNPIVLEALWTLDEQTLFLKLKLTALAADIRTAIENGEAIPSPRLARVLAAIAELEREVQWDETDDEGEEACWQPGLPLRLPGDG